MSGLTKAARGIGGGWHGGSATAAWRDGIRRELHWRGVWQPHARIHLQVVFSTGRAVAFAGVFIAQAGQFVAPTDAVAVAGFRSGFDRN